MKMGRVCALTLISFAFHTVFDEHNGMFGQKRKIEERRMKSN